MKRWFVLLLLASPVVAVELPVEVIVSGHDEPEADVCDRANRKAINDAIESLTAGLSDRRPYHRLLDEYRFRGHNREVLEEHLGAAVAEHLQYVPVEQVWTGRSCLVRGLAEVDESTVFASVEGDLPEAPQVSRPVEEEEDGGWFDSFPGVGGFFAASQVSSALAEMTPLKIYVSEYYLQHDSWPDSLTAMGIDPAEFRRSQYIEQVTVEDGALRAELKGRLDGEWIMLSPSMGVMGSINWSCRLSVSVPLGPCDGP